MTQRFLSSFALPTLVLALVAACVSDPPQRPPALDPSNPRAPEHEAGNINDLALTQERTSYEQATLDLERDELALVEARESVNRLLGLWGPRTS